MSNRTSKHDLAWALERVKAFDPTKGLMPYQEGMMVLVAEIERLRNALAQSVETVRSLMRPDETTALPHASAALKEFMAALGEIMSMEDGATPADYLQRARDIREWCHDHQTPLDFVESLKIAESVFEKYRNDQPKWWRRMDGTPILNDVAVRMAEAFRDHYRPAVEPQSPREPTAFQDFVESLPEEPVQPHKYATHGPCHICGGQPGDAIHAENGSALP
jgi:hypothetical protein